MDIYLETNSFNPHFNLAFEEYILNHWKLGTILILWQNGPTVVVGQNQNTEAEINRSFIQEHGIQVVRRNTGGGAVYHDFGNLNYSFITDVCDAAELTMDLFTRPIVNALKHLGLNAEASGRNDILVNGYKVSGTAQRIAGNRILHHGTLLFDADLDMAAGALCADARKFQSKGLPSVRSRIANIRPFLSMDMDMNAFWDYLKKQLLHPSFFYGKLDAEERAAVEILRQQKYESWEWNYGHSPQFEMKNSCHFFGGCLDIGMTVKNGQIADIAFSGDYLSVCSVYILQKSLIGCQFQPDAVAAVLDKVPLHQYLGSIRKQEVLQLMFAGE